MFIKSVICLLFKKIQDSQNTTYEETISKVKLTSVCTLSTVTRDVSYVNTKEVVESRTSHSIQKKTNNRISPQTSINCFCRTSATP